MIVTIDGITRRVQETIKQGKRKQDETEDEDTGIHGNIGIVEGSDREFLGREDKENFNHCKIGKTNKYNKSDIVCHV